ncbi:MAG: serine hydrolase domain-containing protein [Sphingomonadales bacterium]
MHTSIMALAALLLAGSALAAPATTETPGKTGTGNSFTQPIGFDMAASGAVVELTAPEADSKAAIVDVGAAPDAAAATAKAWALWAGHAAPPVRLATALPAKSGWEERLRTEYDIAPNAKRYALALAQRRGDRWTVLLNDVAEAVADKRGAAFNLIAQSLRPAGYAPESFAGKAANKLTPERIALLKQFVADGMQALAVPGVGLAFIEDGKVLWEGGLGVRKLGDATPVDAHTRFMIASNTISMATMLLAELADQGKLKWDQKVTQLYPGFRLGNDATTASVEVRHLVCACTGLPRKDMEWLFATTAQTPASDTFRQLAATQPTSKFGEAFQYNNLMASAAGYVAGSLFNPGMELGAAFDKAVADHIWRPLGMADSTFSFAVANAGNHANPHGTALDGTTVFSPSGDAINITIAPFRPAGGAWSSPHDMIRYVGLELADGRLSDGKQLVSKDNLFARRARGVPLGENQWYGMGLMEDSRWGVPVIHHGGDLLGFHSDMMWVPSAGVGAVILTNSDDGVLLRGPLLRRLLEVLYDGKPEAAAELAAAVARTKAEAAEFRARVTSPADPAVVAGLAARYRNADLGPVTVSKAGGTLHFDFTAWGSDMGSHRNTDGTISLISISPGIAGLDMVVGSANGQRTLTLRDSQHEYVFTEVTP